MKKLNAYNILNSKSTPQSMPIPGRKDMVKNNAGGYVFQVNDWKRLERFLIIGTEGGTYYVRETPLTLDNANVVMRCLEKDAKLTIDTIASIGDSGRAIKNDPALFALAIAASKPNDPAMRAYALSKLSSVARIGTHLFHFVQYVDGMRGWGRPLRDAVGNWYNGKTPDNLAFQLAKYQQRDGWSHRDVLRVAHPAPVDLAHNNLFKWAVGDEVNKEDLNGLVKCLVLMGEAKTEDEVIGLINEYRAPREIVPTQFQNKPAVWEALIPNLGYEALVRNLGNISKSGLMSSKLISQRIVDRIVDEEAVKRSRIHPIKLLVGKLTYAQGHGVRGDSSWNVDRNVSDAVEKAIYMAFKYTEPTGKNIMLAMDISGSMSQYVSGSELLSCHMAEAVIALAIAKKEQNSYIRCFDTQFQDPNITADMTINQAYTRLSRMHMGGTDCAQPMIYAHDHNLKVDAFVVITDNETWAGPKAVPQALRAYRQKSGINSKLIVLGMTSTQFSIADPTDLNQIDIAGFDTEVPGFISDFVREDQG